MALTLAINATLAKPLLNYFQLVEDNAIEKQLVMNQIKKLLRRRMIKVLKYISVNKNLNTQELENIRRSCSLLKEVRLEDFENEDFSSSVDVASKLSKSL